MLVTVFSLVEMQLKQLQIRRKHKLVLILYSLKKQLPKNGSCFLLVWIFYLLNLAT